MRMVMISVGLLFSLISGQAMAQCTGTPLTQSQIFTLIRGKYACVGTSPNAEWNELHSGTGTTASTLTDYKLGPTSPTDPSTNVGTWIVTAVSTPQTTGTITYNYGDPGSPYSYLIYNVNGITLSAGGVVSFCGIGSAPTLAVTVQASHC